MERRTNSPYPRRDGPYLLVVAIALLIPLAVLAWQMARRDWRYYQWEFRSEVTQKLGADKAATIPAGLQQIWIPELRRADRCPTCHQALSWKGFEQSEEPFRTHPPEILAKHPAERFGCTICHGGQGYATDLDEAHGPAPHWEEPVLGSFLGDSYSLAAEHGSLLQMNCNLCHRYERETKGASEINLAKALVQEKGCRACHVVNGRGGSIGPDLTYVGDKAPEQYDYSRLAGQKTTFAWHVAHFKDPRALVPETVMPNFHLSTRQAQGLSMLVMSWRREDLPASFIAGTPRTEPQTKEELEADAKMRSGPGAWFVSTGCFVCHSISVFGVVSPAQIGPDLSVAVEDVQSRFGVTVDDFLRAPTGTMAVVLSRQIILTDEQKAFAVKKLHEAFDEYQRQQAAKKKEGGK